jgi:hypothetical protein
MLSSMGIQASDSNARSSHPTTFQKIGKQSADAYDLFVREKSRHVSEGNMRGHERHGERATGQQHGKVLYPSASGKKLRLSWKGKSSFMKLLLTDWPCHHRSELSSDGTAGSLFEGGNSTQGTFTVRMSRMARRGITDDFEADAL